MSVHAINQTQAILNPQRPAVPPPATSAIGTSFGDILGALGSSKPSTAPVSTASSNTTATAPTGFAALFSSNLSTTPAPSGPPTIAPPFVATYEQGAVVTDVVGGTNPLNSIELATASTAAQVAQLLGGTVVNMEPTNGVTQTVPTRMISVPGATNEINAGLAASLFAQFGTAQGSMAYKLLDKDLGIA